MERFTDRLKRRIARRRGLDLAEKGKLRPVTIPQTDGNKTLAMRLIEAQFGTSIEVLIADGKERDVADRLGLHPSTISKWRLRLGLRP